MQTLTVGSTLYYLPETIDDAKSLIRQAKHDNKTIVMRGAGHSFPMTPEVEANNECIHVCTCKSVGHTNTYESVRHTNTSLDTLTTAAPEARRRTVVSADAVACLHVVRETELHIKADL